MRMIDIFGVTTEEALSAFEKFCKALPPPGDKEIELIKRNPSLSPLQKRRLIKDIEKIKTIHGIDHTHF